MTLTRRRRAVLFLFIGVTPLETSADRLTGGAIDATEIGEWSHRQDLHYGPSPGLVLKPARLVVGVRLN